MTLRARLALAAALAVIAFGSLDPAPAQDKKKADGGKDPAKASAVENLKKAGVAKPTAVETKNFVVAGSLPESKARALGAALEKTLAVARKAAKFDEKESPWKGGRLVVYFLPDSDEYQSFMRRVLQVRPEGAHADFRAEPSFLVDPVELPGKPTEADQYAATAARVAGELLKAKGTGTQRVPEWLREGFGRVSAMRAEGTGSKRYLAYRAQAKAAAFGTKTGRPAAIADVWGGQKSPGSDALANSLAEFVAFGPKAAEFDKFIDALRPGEGNMNPTAMSGFMALGWKDEAAAEAAWKRWVQTGR
jgi:hypothetical protein